MRATSRVSAVVVLIAALIPVMSGAVMAGTPPPPVTVTRLSGADRYATAAAVLATAFTGSVANAIVVNGADWPDMIIADSMAGELGAPVLPVRQDSIPAPIAARLALLHPTHIYVVGGTTILSASVLATLRALYTPNPVTRYGGADRFATAGLALTATYGTVPSAGVIADDDWHANLYAAYCGAVGRIPIVPVAPKAVAPLLPPSIAALLTHLAPQSGGIVGDRISPPVQAQVETYFSNPIQPLPGADDYALELTLIQFCNNGQAAPLFLASGQDYSDALAAASSIAAMHGNLLLLNGTTVPPALVTLLGQLDPSQVYVLGGPGLLSDAYIASVVAHLTPPGP